jgi:hypothetical protein
MASPGSGSARTVAEGLNIAWAKRRLDRLNQRDATCDLVGNEAAQLLGRRDDGGSVARHLGRRQHEMDVVRVVPEAIHAHGRIGRRQIFLVHPDRGLVVGQRVKIAPDPAETLVVTLEKSIRC